jgi:hypothetical protein
MTMVLTDCWHKRREECQLRKAEKAEDSQCLMRIWRKSPHEDVRFEIINKLQDQGCMAVIAQGDPSSSVRAEAVKRLEDEALLRRISLSDSSDFVRAMARAHFEYAGPEPWLAAEDDEELRRMVLDFLMKHASPANRADTAEGETYEHDRRKNRILRRMRAAK